MFVCNRKILALIISFIPVGLNAQPPAGVIAPKSAADPSAAHAVHPNSLTIAYPQYLWPKVSGVATVYYAIDSASDPKALSNIQTAISTFNSDFQHFDPVDAVVSIPRT
jgi:hypothetical protein